MAIMYMQPTMSKISNNRNKARNEYFFPLFPQRAKKMRNPLMINRNDSNIISAAIVDEL